jgi:hypothetical protein
MAFTFEKVGTSGLSIYWDNGDMEFCGNSTYTYSYFLYRNGSIYNSVNNTFSQGWSWGGLPSGTY